MKITTPPESLTTIEMTYEEWRWFQQCHPNSLIADDLNDRRTPPFPTTLYYSIGGRIIEIRIKEDVK